MEKSLNFENDITSTMDEKIYRFYTYIIYCSYMLSREYRVVKNRYSRLLFTSKDRLCANLRKKNWRIRRHNASTSRSRDVTDHLRWRNERWRNERSMIVISAIGCSGHKIACKKWNYTFITVNNDFGDSWCGLPMIFTRYFVPHENHCQITSLVTT